MMDKMQQANEELQLFNEFSDLALLMFLRDLSKEKQPWVRRMKLIGQVTAEIDFNSVIIECDHCKARWSPSLSKAVKYRLGIWQCARECNDQ